MCLPGGGGADDVVTAPSVSYAHWKNLPSIFELASLQIDAIRRMQQWMLQNGEQVCADNQLAVKESGAREEATG